MNNSKFIPFMPCNINSKLFVSFCFPLFFGGGGGGVLLSFRADPQIGDRKRIRKNYKGEN